MQVGPVAVLVGDFRINSTSCTLGNAHQEEHPYDLTVTAGIILMLAGFFGILQGIVGLVNNEFYVVTQKWVFQFDTTTWGWIHITVGLIALGAGFGLFAGPGLGADRRRHRGVPQHDRQLPLAAVLPVVGVADHRLRRVRYLGRNSTWSRPEQHVIQTPHRHQTGHDVRLTAPKEGRDAGSLPG